MFEEGTFSLFAVIIGGATLGGCIVQEIVAALKLCAFNHRFLKNKERILRNPQIAKDFADYYRIYSQTNNLQDDSICQAAVQILTRLGYKNPLQKVRQAMRSQTFDDVDKLVRYILK